MRKITFVKDILPHLIAVIAFLLITVFFFNPVFFDNKSLDQHDIQMWEGSSRALRDFRDKTGEEGLWAPGMFSGMPAYLVNVEWSNGPVLAFKKILSLGLPHPVANIFIAFVCYYILLLSFGVRPYLAIAGAVAFGLSSYLIIGLAAGHNARIGAIAFMPLIMAGIHLTFSGKRVLGFGVTTLGMALHLRENHLQITYYLMFIVIVYGIVRLIEFIRQGRAIEFAKSIALLIPAVLLAAATFFGQFWAITEYSRYSIRGPSELTSKVNTTAAAGLDKEYTFQGKSNGIWEPMTLMIPDIYGGSSMNLLVNDQGSNVYKALVQSGNQEMANQLASYTSGYWGPQSLAAPYYAGAIICFLFVMGILYSNKMYVWWLLPLSILSIVLTWGDNFSSFNYFMLDYFPGYNKFRSVTFALVIILFTMPLLGMLGLENLLKKGWSKDTIKKLAWPLGLTLGVCLVLAVSGGFGGYLRDFEEQLPVWFTNALREDRKDLLRADAWRSFWFIGIFSIVLYARLKNWIKDPIFFLLAAILITFDISFVSKRYLNYQRRKLQNTFTAYASDQEILKDKSYYRVYNLQGAFNEARTSFFHNSIGGYHGAKLRRYQDLYDSCLFRETQQMISDVQSGKLDFTKYGVLNMLNVKYIVYGPDQGNIIPNPESNGSAWFVNEIEKVSSPVEELAKICDVNTGTVAVVDGSKFDVPEIVPDSAASILLTEFQPNHLKYESQTQSAGLAVFSEIFYPKGWIASIDGQEATILRADYVLRALAIPAGKHTIEFKFKPKPYMIGNKITMAGSWLLLIVVLGSLGWTFRNHEKETS
ncbi:MAG TPA: YfhO family protein [Cyclobacteriaceae bacterium]|nr:YfhO family protein [Cyclobacteriaceae bacterium]